MSSVPPVAINLNWVAPFADTKGQREHWMGFRETELVAVLTQMEFGNWRVTASPRGPGYGGLHKVVDTAEAAEAFLRLHLDGVPVGTQLKWIAAARGGKVQKVGVVQDVIQADQELTAEQRLETGARGHPRDFRSYLVRVFDDDGVSSSLHWPKTGDLEVVNRGIS